MNSAFLRLFVAVAAFALSVGLTNVVRVFRAGDATIAPVTTWPWYEEQILAGLYHEYGPAQTRHDRAFFERVETEDFILFLGEQHISREDDIRWMENLPDGVVYETYPESIKILGDWAVVNGRMEARHRNGYVNSWGFVDVWVHHGDTWRIQSTTATD
ncbi:MAG TPA: nuclear transport factor 2 family protein [Pyrinomonadaceae bacterium]|jgi:Domain of unknown function (DUF4440)|nr:nuclear transport factor 2 family protein [Pyrinomonadaceae bacterium]